MNKNWVIKIWPKWSELSQKMTVFFTCNIKGCLALVRGGGVGGVGGWGHACFTCFCVFLCNSKIKNFLETSLKIKVLKIKQKS